MITLKFDDKDPLSVLNYQLDFTDLLADIAPVSVVSLTWAIQSPAGDLTPVTIGSHTEDSPITQSTVSLAGGTLGNGYLARCTVTLSDGEVMLVSFSLGVSYT